MAEETEVVETPAEETPKTDVVETITEKEPEKTTEEAPKEETKDDSLLGEKQEPEVPESYEVKLPEGQEVDTELLTTLTPVLQKHKISQEALQELAETYAPQMQKHTEGIQKQIQEEQQRAFDEVRQELKDETMKILGENAKTELAVAGKFIEKFGSQEVREKLVATGLDNDPDVVQMLIKAGKAISEDAFVEPSKTSSPSTDMILDEMYPTMAKK